MFSVSVFGAFAEHMTSELKVATVLDQFFLWDKVERLATPGVTNVAHDCGITAAKDIGLYPLSRPSLMPIPLTGTNGSRGALRTSSGHMDSASSPFGPPSPMKRW